VLALAIWLGLLGTGFWLCTERDDRVRTIELAEWPDVVAVIPARNEADVIARSLGSVIRQDYPGTFRVILVDDNSGDGTGAIARGLGSACPSTSSGRADVGADVLSAWNPQTPLSLSLSKATHDPTISSKPPHDLTVLSGAPLAPGWTGKLWALSQGIAAAGKPQFLWLTDADIEHAPDTLRRLVGIALTKDRRLVSFMAKLHCQTWPERALVPAFIWFFMMLYPFNWINRRSPIAGAAGGCVLVERTALEAAGGIAAMRGALIDDCTLGALIKRQGPIWLGLTDRSRSIRPYESVAEIAAMISRSAYAQLRFNPAILALTIMGLALVFGLPAALLFASGAAQLLGLLACVLMVIAYQPLLRFYRRSPLWGLALPLVATFYAWCTLVSAWQHGQGRGGMWKGRAQAAPNARSAR
jgi:hopene-associated glycosyltransferase HpnB